MLAGRLAGWLDGWLTHWLSVAFWLAGCFAELGVRRVSKSESLGYRGAGGHVRLAFSRTVAIGVRFVSTFNPPAAANREHPIVG